MGSPLCPILANVVGFYESFLFENYYKLHMHLHYVDDTFSIFDSITDAEAFHTQLDHPSIYDASDKWLYFAFFDVMVQRKYGLFITSIYHSQVYTPTGILL